MKVHPLRVVFMGTPDFAVPSLEVLVRRPDLCQVVGVWTQPDRPQGRGMKVVASPVKTVATRHRLPVFQPEKLSQAGEPERVRSLQPDLAVVIAYGQILKREVLSLPKHGCVNLHASLLPRWRGAAPIQRALWAGDSVTGVTLMRMDEGLDTGPMIIKKVLPIQEKDDSPSLFRKLGQLSSDVLVEGIETLVRDGHWAMQPQVASLATLAPKLKKSDQWIRWDLGTEQVSRQIRALRPWPGTSVMTHDGRRLRVLEMGERRPVDSQRPPAGRLEIQMETRTDRDVTKEKRIFLTCADGLLEIVKAQWDGRDPWGAQELIHSGEKFPLELRQEWLVSE